MIKLLMLGILNEIVQEFVKPNTFIMLENIPRGTNIMPVVAYCVEATIEFDVIHGAN